MLNMSLQVIANGSKPGLQIPIVIDKPGARVGLIQSWEVPLPKISKGCPGLLRIIPSIVTPPDPLSKLDGILIDPIAQDPESFC